MAIKHVKVVTTPDDGTSEVGTDEWNDNHTIDGDVNFNSNNITGVEYNMDTSCWRRVPPCQRTQVPVKAGECASEWQ